MNEIRSVRFANPLRRSRNASLPQRGFLVIDLIAGIAVAGLALLLAGSILKADLQVRRTREARFRMLLKFENALARAEARDPGELTQAALKSILDELSRGEPVRGPQFDVTVTDLPGKPAGKRVVLRASVAPAQVGGALVHTGGAFLMRDFFARERKP